MKIVSVALKSLRNGEYISYMRAYLRVFDRNDPVALGVEDQFDALTANVDAVELVFKQDQASELTEVIADLDILRDKYLIGIASVVNGYLSHYDEGMVQMAKLLDHRIAVYGTPTSIATQPLQQQLATVDNLVYDLQNETGLSAALTALHLADWVGQLQLANDNLRGAYDERTQEQASLPADSIKDLRVAGYDLYYRLRDMMMAQALIADYASPYDTVINEVNDLSTRFNDTMARRGGTGSLPEEGGEDDVGE